MNKSTNELWTAAIEAALALVELQRIGNLNNLVSYGLEHRTVRLSAGSRNGLSTWIARTASSRDLIVIPGDEFAKTFVAETNPSAQVVSVNWPHYSGGAAPERIFVDRASTLTKQQVDLIYQATANNPNQLWFLLG